MNDKSQNWFAVYTKPRQEQVALANLERQSFECFLPMVEGGGRRRIAGNRPAQEPLFPRYLFLHADQNRQSLAVVRSTIGAVGLVRAGFELITIPEPLIAGLKTRVNRASGLIPMGSAGLIDGDKVQVFDGPFAQFEGVFKEHRGRTRSLLLLEILGRETAVEIDSRLLKRAI